MTLGAAVLTGGLSRRMGRTKALIEVDGRAMGDRVIDAARSVGAEPVVLIGGDPNELESLGAPVVPDRYPGEGPVAGILGALRHFEGTADRVLVLPCDLAHVEVATLLPLLEAERGDGVALVWVAATDRLEPMCAIWSVDATERIQELFDAGERAAHVVIGELPHVAVTVDPAGLANINTPDELPG